MSDKTKREFDDDTSSLPGVIGMLDTVVSKFEAIALAVGVLLMALNAVIAVVARFGFSYSIFFAEELNRILIILITFAGISYAARHGRHIRMSAIYDAMSARMRKLLMITMAFITAMFMFALCYYSVKYIGTVRRTLPALQWPEWIIYIWVPVGFFMTGLQYLLTGIKNILERDIYLSTNVLEGYDETEIEISNIAAEKE